MCLKRVGSPHFSRFVLVPVHFHIMLVPLSTFRRFARFPLIFGVIRGPFDYCAVFTYISFTGYLDSSHVFLSSFADNECLSVSCSRFLFGVHLTSPWRRGMTSLSNISEAFSTVIPWTIVSSTLTGTASAHIPRQKEPFNSTTSSSWCSWIFLRNTSTMDCADLR